MPRLWNERFQITESKDNTNFHSFYKEFFDKPVKRKDEHLSLSVMMKPKDPKKQQKEK